MGGYGVLLGVSDMCEEGSFDTLENIDDMEFIEPEYGEEIELKGEEIDFSEDEII